MKTTKLILKLILLSIFVSSCNENDTVEEALDTYTDGVIISAEGNFGNKDGSISYVSEDYSIASNFIYSNVNEAQLGGLIQSIAFSEDKAFVVLNDVNTIVVVDRYTFKKEAVITEGFENPRYMEIVGDFGYVTNWGDTANETDDYLAVVDLNTYTVSASIPVELGPERILKNNTKLYISHKGAFGLNNKISVLDTDATENIETITVNDRPDELVINSSGDLVVLSEGDQEWVNGDDGWYVASETKGAIQTIDLNTNTVIKTIEFADGVHPNLLAVDNGNIYYHIGYQGVFRIAETASQLSQESPISTENLYGLNVKNDLIYGVQYSFTQLSKLIVTDASTKSVVYSTGVGLGASKIYFN